MTLLDQSDFEGLHVLNGAMATELEKHGCNIAGSLSSADALLESPDIIRDVQLSYPAAGADRILTAVFCKFPFLP